MEIPEKLAVFAHGKESGPWGTKITRLAELARQRGYEVLSPDYSRTADARVRVQMLCTLAPRAGSALVLVGSSMGGYVSAMACAALQPQALLLIAPALYFPGYDEEPPPPPPIVAVVHGWQDEVVPVARAIRYAQRHHAALHLFAAGHTLECRLPELATIFDTLLAQAAVFGAYRKARYVVDAPGGAIELRVDHSDPAAGARLRADCRIQQRWALVTACNPASELRDADDNAARNHRLIARLDRDGVRHIPGRGADPQGRWPDEASRLLCDPPPGYAEALGREFGQYAILAGVSGSAPKLVWLK